MTEPAGPGEARDDLVSSGVAAAELRRAMANFATGVTVVTTVDAGVAYGITCNSFTSISLAPPLVMVSVSQHGRFHDHLVTAGTWAVSVLASAQGELARHFANPARDRRHQFATVAHSVSVITGSPLITGALAWLECRTTQVVAAGDHTMVLGSVLGAQVSREPGAPLTYFRGAFLELPRSAG